MQKKQKWFFKTLLGLLLSIICLLGYSSDSYAAPAEYTDLMANATYNESTGKYEHHEGDAILIEDYTLPEDTALGWYNGNLTIASGVTLTISEGSYLEIAAGKNRLFLLEEGATIRILGEPELNEYDALSARLDILHMNAEINGTIESNAQGIDASCSSLRLNGTIHSNGPALYIEQCDIVFFGGEYLTNGSSIIERKYEQAFEYFVTVYGGVFSKEMSKTDLADGVEMHKLEDGTYEAVAIPEDDQAQTIAETGNNEENFFGKIKHFCHAAIQKAKEVFNEAVDANGGMKEAWKKPEFLVLMIMVFGIAAGFLYYIYDFIRAPLKQKFKILIETFLVIVIVGGGLWLIWEYVTKDLESQQAMTRPEYSEDVEITRTVINDSRSFMNGLEAYGPGIYQVGKDIEPGVYYLEAATLSERINPFYVFFSKTPDFSDKEIGLWVSRSYVEFESGWYITVIDANFIEAGKQAVYEPSEIDDAHLYTSGEYLVGRDIMPGTYSYEPSNEETFWIDLRNNPITANEVSWTSYAAESSDAYNMGTEPAQITLTDGQTITISPWSGAKLTFLE